MRKRRLGNSTLDITVMGLGAWAIGGEWRFGWGPQDDAESMAAIRRAVELGINWIDTAPAYGLGHSEEIVGRALKEMSPGDRPYVFTKCSLVWDESGTVSHNLRPQSIRREVEGSLKRLGVERIDLYQIHWPLWPGGEAGYDPGPLEEGWEAMAALRREGKIAHAGVSNFDEAQLRRIQQIEPPTSLQPPYSLLRREIEDGLLPFCQANNIGVIVYSPMQSGLLTGKMTRERIASLPATDWRRAARYFKEPTLTRALTLVERLEEVSARYGRTPGEVAIAWTLRHPAVTAAIVGARRPQQVDELVGAASLQLNEGDVSYLNRC
jgi:aryl-alcohol dehydrogenase-like predicted oxidoreductase